MSDTEIQTVRRVIALLYTLIDGPQECAAVPRHSPIQRFVEEYLVANATGDITCEEAWRFFYEIVQAGELPPMRKAVFLRQLPMLMEEAFQTRKCHHVEHEGSHVRGFKGVGLRLDAGSE